MAQQQTRRAGKDPGVERDFEAYRLLLGLWQSENPIKTLKLQVLLAVNALLVAALAVAGGPAPGRWYLYATGLFVSLVWTFSIGRTSLFQDVWQARLAALRARHPDDARFALLDNRAERRAARRSLRILGGVPSRWYLLASPIVFAVGWLALWIHTGW
jgi:hypothetical protein